MNRDYFSYYRDNQHADYSAGSHSSPDTWERKSESQGRFDWIEDASLIHSEASQKRDDSADDRIRQLSKHVPEVSHPSADVEGNLRGVETDLCAVVSSLSDGLVQLAFLGPLPKKLIHRQDVSLKVGPEHACQISSITHNRCRIDNQPLQQLDRNLRHVIRLVETFKKTRRPEDLQNAYSRLLDVNNQVRSLPAGGRIAKVILNLQERTAESLSYLQPWLYKATQMPHAFGKEAAGRTAPVHDRNIKVTPATGSSTESKVHRWARELFLSLPHPCA